MKVLIVIPPQQEMAADNRHSLDEQSGRVLPRYQ